jgi:hypothetical protein
MIPMKRGLRFRIWNKEEKKYLENIENFLIDLVPNSNAKVLEYRADERANFIIEQTTDMRTKEGLEVFEGDILEFVWAGSKKLAQIKYRYGSYIAELLDNEGTLCFHFLHSLARYDCPISIVGNINENPEYKKT